MTVLKKIPLTIAALLVFFAGFSAAEADAIEQLPVQITAGIPALLLELGSEPGRLGVEGKSIQTLSGEVSSHEGDSSISIDKDEISSLHPGFGAWKVGFRFKLKAAITAQPYLFWARWKQGGVPDVCVQSFEIWAGLNPAQLEKRATLAMKPKGWEYAWIAAETPINLKADDTLIEIRDSGSGHDAKIFDAFLFSAPAATLPASGTLDKPLIVLDLGKSPLLAALAKNPNLQVQTGTASVGQGAESLLLQNDEVQVFHQGFGNWGANFLFELNPALAPGNYRIYARYKSGGEVSQVRQSFTVKAGAKPEQLASRAEFALLNNTPWEYQWLPAEAKVTVLPGDRWLSIENTGKADGAKVFDAFLMKLESPLGEWMSVSQAELRNRFLAMTNNLPDAKQHLYLLDGEGEKDGILFRGLAADAVKPHYQKLAVSYLIGAEANTLARQLAITAFPAAVIADDHFTVLGVLTKPDSEAAVLNFLADPVGGGMMPKPAAVSGDTAKPLRDGVPEAWLTGGLQDGRAGMSIFGLDNETVLRPNPGQPYLSLEMMGGKIREWRVSPTQADGVTDIEPNTQHTYGWSRGSGYAQLYLHVDQATQAQLHVQQAGVNTAGWLDGKPLALSDDPQPPGGMASPVASVKKLLQGLTTEGLVSIAQADKLEKPQIGTLNLSPGWHSLLIKLVMQLEQDRRFNFKALFTDSNGQPLNTIKTRLSDPDADPVLNRIAAKLRPQVYVDAPANLPHPGDPLKIRVDLRWHPILEEAALATPLLRFPAKLRLRLLDYAGKEIAVREISGVFPGEVEADFGKIEEQGYYAVYPSLFDSAGRLIMNYPADGFSVISGNAEQKYRLEKKKLWNNNYYALADGDKSFQQADGYFAWLERMGVFKSYGSYPGFDPQYLPKWQQAKQQGLLLFADSSGDSAWLNDSQADGEKFIGSAAAYTRFFKATNEIDIRREPEWQKLRNPEHWLQRAKWEYEQVHKQRGDAHYVGGSLVRPAEDPWFKQVLQLGLDRYQDAWDVHAYPQNPPRFGGPIGNGGNEDEQGVLAVYASLGQKNSLPFWLGETGAKAMHGLTGRRWQAEQVAKIIAWVNSRSDYLGLAFCIGHEYDLGYGRIWDYSMGHKPGEAAMYTAGALIDGLPYQAVETKDANIQAGRFGETLMVWRSDDTAGLWRQALDPAKHWLVVDVVGRSQTLPVGADGYADIPVSASPVYVLTESGYKRLIR